jgi:hypothetical protein
MPSVSELVNEKKGNLARYLAAQLTQTPEVTAAIQRLAGMPPADLILATRLFLAPQRANLDGCVDHFLQQTGLRVDLTPEVRQRVVRYMECFCELCSPA